MKTSRDFVPTHRISYRDGKGTMVYEVMLVDGAGYTKIEWDAEATADFEMNEDGEWTLAGHAFNGSVEALPKTVPCCSQCGGTNVEDTAWVEYREDGSERVSNSEGPLTEGWCADCEEEVDLDYPDWTPAQLKQRQQNNAAREHGPELLDALRSMMTLAHSHFLLKGKTASSSDFATFNQAKQLIELLTNGNP